MYESKSYKNISVFDNLNYINIYLFSFEKCLVLEKKNYTETKFQIVWKKETLTAWKKETTLEYFKVYCNAMSFS